MGRQETIQEIKRHSSILTKQQYRTLLGKAKQDDDEAVLKGLITILKRKDKEGVENGRKKKFIRAVG